MIERLRSERETLIASARAAHEAATHAESAAEDPYDTRGIEASYLAGAQAQRVQELERRLQGFHSLMNAVLDRKSIDVGALAKVKAGSREVLYFVVGDGGGLSVQVDGQAVNLITPQAPLGEALLGKVAGDEIELDVQGQTREYAVLEVV